MSAYRKVAMPDHEDVEPHPLRRTEVATVKGLDISPRGVYLKLSRQNESTFQSELLRQLMVTNNDVPALHEAVRNEQRVRITIEPIEDEDA